MARVRTDKEIARDKHEAIMNIIAKRCAYYRANPHRFVEEFLGIKLKLFQKILIWAMIHSDAFYFIAARSLGKTFLLAVYACVRCILYPGSKIVVTSYTFKQAKMTLSKITDELMPRSPLLRNEIGKVSIGQNEAIIYFKGRSWIKAVVAGESGRGDRGNMLIVDESRLVPQKIVDTILMPMLGTPRQPGYLNKPEYSHLQEMNTVFYLSSAFYSASEMYEKVKAYTANMLDPNLRYFVCDLPYMLAIKEGLLVRQQIINEMSEATFSDITFSMERMGLFYGASDDALFDFKTLEERRVLTSSLFGLDYYRIYKKSIPEKQRDEVRVLSVDVALLASKKHDNDASSIMIHSGIPTSTNDYVDNIVYIDSAEGLVTEDLGLLIMRDYYQYNCDYIVLDCSGVGLPVLDYLMQDRYDPVYSRTYGALNVCNNPDLADRCKVKNAPRVIFAIKATSKSNNDMCLSLRAGFQNGYINLLVNEFTADNYISSIRGTGKLSDGERAELKMPYLQTTFLINELVNLTYETQGGYIKVKEKYGMRKDRYSSLMYGYYAIQELSKKNMPKSEDSLGLADKLIGTMRQSSLIKK